MREELTGLRKAAIVLLSLGQRQAAAVLRRLPPEAARAVRKEMRRVGALRAVSLRTRQLVLGHFCAAASPYPPLPEPLTTQPEASALPGPFAALGEAQAENLLDTIRDEHPQTIALVLAHLPPDKASEVLAGLENPKQLEVVKRIAGIEQTSAQVIEQVENSLRQRLGAIMGRTIRSGGVSAVAEILNSAADDRFEDQILSGLEAESPDLAQQVRRAAAIFENLMDASDDDVQAVIGQLDLPTISLALRTARDDLRRKFMWNLPQEHAGQVARDMASLEPVSVRDIERAQQRVAEVVHRLESAGEIDAMERRNQRRLRSGVVGVVGGGGVSGGDNDDGERRKRNWKRQHRKAV